MAMTLISTNPDSTDIASYEITSGIDSTYKLYIFKFYDVNVATDGAYFTVDFSIDGGSNYNLGVTSIYFVASHTEADDVAAVDKTTSLSQHGETDPQEISGTLDNLADTSGAGTLWLFNPSGTTYSKFFQSTVDSADNGGYQNNVYVDGKIQTASAINAVKFSTSSGNFDGVIKMYGVK